MYILLLITFLLVVGYLPVQPTAFKHLHTCLFFFIAQPVECLLECSKNVELLRRRAPLEGRRTRCKFRLLPPPAQLALRRQQAYYICNIRHTLTQSYTQTHM